MKKVIFFVINIMLGVVFSAGAQDDPFDPIIKAIRDSDAKSLSAVFNTTVDLRLPDNENTYSASQGEMVMKDFFKKYPPDSFTLIQKGAIDNLSRFAICNYLSGSMQYQVCIDIKKEKEKEKYLVQKIKFEVKK
jgi:hypothetical protein